MPVGVQLGARPWQDAELIAIGLEVQAAVPFWLDEPVLVPAIARVPEVGRAQPGPGPDPTNTVGAAAPHDHDRAEPQRIATVGWNDADVVVSNDHIPLDWEKRPGARYLQTWHGTMLKRIHNDVLWAPEGRLAYLEQDIARWDLLLSPNSVSTSRPARAARWTTASRPAIAASNAPGSRIDPSTKSISNPSRLPRSPTDRSSRTATAVASVMTVDDTPVPMRRVRRSRTDIRSPGMRPASDSARASDETAFPPWTSHTRSSAPLHATISGW